MALADIMRRVREAVLCCGDKGKKQSMEISLPTNVRRGVLPMSGLSKEQEEYIREKASSPNTSHLLSLTSHPPTRPSSPPPQPSSPTPSTTLLNSASANLPTTLPTPPRREHSDSHMPAPAHHSRMKGFWERTRRLSTHSHSGYQGLDKRDEEGVVLLNLEFRESEIELESPVSGKSVVVGEGFEVQDVVGGSPHSKRGDGIEVRDVANVDAAERSSSDDEEAQGGASAVLGAERVPLVTA